MLDRMKRYHRAKRGVNYLPFHDASPNNNSVSNHLIISNTGAGKTYFANKLLTQTNSEGLNYALGRDIVCFSVHPDDPSLAPARKLHKKRWLDVNIKKVDGALDVEMLPKGCLCVFDDCLELGMNDFRTKVLYDLISQVCTVGRHHAKPGKRGVEAIVITHHGSRKQLQTCRQSCRFWTLFPQQKQQCAHILKNRLQLTKRQILKLLSNCSFFSSRCK